MNRRAAVRVWGLIGLLAVGALVLFMGPVRSLPFATPPVELPWWGFAIGFAATEYFVIHLHLRRDAHSLSLSELPLLLGYGFLAAPALLLARLLGAAFTLVVLRRQVSAKLAFNLSLFALEAVVGLIIFRSILGAHPPTDSRAWIAAGAATLATDVLGSVAISAAIWSTEGRVQLGMLREVGVIGTFLALCNAAVGVLVLSVLWTSTEAIVPLVAVAAFMYIGYRAHLMLRQRHANLQMLYRFTSATARSGDTREAAAAMLAEVCELLRCEAAEFALVQPDGQVVLRLRLQDDRLLVDDDLPAVDAAEIQWCLSQTAGGAVRFSGSSLPASVRAHMEGLTLKDVMLAPITLELAEYHVGIVVAANRTSEVSTFDDEDVELFEALARHAGVALENGRLVERLQSEAAEKAHQANHDSLTGLPNRKLFQAELTAACQTSLDDGTGFAVLLLDLDNFKDVNDTLGHATGDLLLQEVALRLSASLRPGDGVARLGGDEFAVLVRNVAPDAAMVVADRLIQKLNRPCALDGIAVDVRASLGVATCPQHAGDPDELLQRADVAMYAAKHDGRGPVLYAPELDVHTHRRLALAAELRTAIRERRIGVAYQPKVRLSDDVVVGAEALARWNHPEMGQIGPDEFIPIAEETGLIRELTTHVLHRAIEDAQVWHARGHLISVAVNISARSVIDQDFPAHLTDLLRTTGIAPHLLTLEVTESSMMTDREQAVANLTAIAALGVELSIDDFGTGFSSMAYLKRLPLDEIKIDQGFIRTMMVDESDAVIVRSILDLAHNLGMSTVAEGVEDTATSDALLALGCGVAQGYLWSRPVSASALLQLLIHENRSAVPISAARPVAS
ncbi:putative bifunctional diguanylate cyclase/phosphodiesterase [Euzebya pacifica]|uniref:putative bifunctional diguanylate cyclase/phosphodiesterase n=1 Tax=Euzebya pacifica TaxID=1608957 RepID=UPI0030F566F3